MAKIKIILDDEKPEDVRELELFTKSSKLSSIIWDLYQKLHSLSRGKTTHKEIDATSAYYIKKELLDLMDIENISITDNNIF